MIVLLLALAVTWLFAPTAYRLPLQRNLTESVTGLNATSASAPVFAGSALQSTPIVLPLAIGGLSVNYSLGLWVTAASRGPIASSATFGLQISAAGLLQLSHSNATLVAAPIPWNRTTYVMATYSAPTASLYVNGALVNQSLSVAGWSGSPVLVLGGFGGSMNGTTWINSALNATQACQIYSLLSLLACASIVIPL